MHSKTAWELIRLPSKVGPIQPKHSLHPEPLVSGIIPVDAGAIGISETPSYHSCGSRWEEVGQEVS